MGYEFMTKMNQCPVSPQVAAVWFGNEGHLEFDLNDFSDMENLLDVIGNMRHVGGETVVYRYSVFWKRIQWHITRFLCQLENNEALCSC